MSIVHILLKRVTMIAVGIGASMLVLTLFYLSPARPWEAAGRLVVVTRAVPENPALHTLAVTLDELSLIEANDNSERHLTLFSRRAVLDPSKEALTVLLDVDAPAGTYRGITGRLTGLTHTPLVSGETLPVTLAGDTLSIDAPFTITEDATTVIILGFEVGGGLHTRDKGVTYFPTVQLEVRSGATVDATLENAARVEGGTILVSRLFGMDASGRTRVNYREPRGDVPADENVPREEETPSEVPSVEAATSTSEGEEATATTTTAASTTTDEVPSDEAETSSTTSSSS